MLTHDSIIIQIPALKKKPQKTDELEKLLDIFELVKEQKIEFDEKKVSKDYFPVLRRLHKAIQNEQIQAIMMVEDEFVEGIKEKEAEILDALKRAEQEKQRAEQAEEVAKQEKERAEQEKQRAEQAEKIAKQEKQLAEEEKILTIRKLLEKGFSVEEIIEIANVDIKFLKKHNLLK
jgi:ATPase subunit of ABC transporter with duplicated ATPase domains